MSHDNKTFARIQDLLVEQSKIQPHSFTIFYCMKHDEGVIVRGNHHCAPLWLSSKACENSDCSTAWKIHGTFQDGVLKGMVELVLNESINLLSQAYYDNCGGGWRIEYYLNTTIFDENGNILAK